MVLLIRNRIDTLAKGIKSPVGAKAGDTSLLEIDRLTAHIERIVKKDLASRQRWQDSLTVADMSRYYRPDTASRYGPTIADGQSNVSAGIGGDNIRETVEGLQAFRLNVRYPREVRDSVEEQCQVSRLTDKDAQIRLRGCGTHPD